MAVSNPYLGPGGSSGAKPPKKPGTVPQQQVGGFRMPSVLPSGALVSNPAGPLTSGIRGTRPAYTSTMSDLGRRAQFGEPARRAAYATYLQRQEEFRRQRELREYYANPLGTPPPGTVSPVPAISRAFSEDAKKRQDAINAANAAGDPSLMAPIDRIKALNSMARMANIRGQKGLNPSGNLGAVGTEATGILPAPDFAGSGLYGSNVMGLNTRNPADAAQASSQRRRDKQRNQMEYWKGVGASYKERFPAQSAAIDAIIAIEQMPEGTEQQREAKKSAFAEINARGEIAQWRNYLSNGSWSRSEERLGTIDKYADDNRFNMSAMFIDNSKKFGLSQQDIADMIASGIITYGKTKDSQHKIPIATVNRLALETFLSDNFSINSDGRVERKSQGRLVLSDFFLQSAGFKVSSSTGAVSVNRDPSSAAFDMVDIPRRDDDETPDYSAMAADYLQDQNTYETLTSKIETKIRESGGGALLDRIYSGNFDQKDVNNLKKYMYSFDGGTYVQAQNRWLSERILGIKNGEFADLAVARRDEANIAALVEQNQKEREEAREAELKQAQGTAEANFRRLDEATGQYVNVFPVEEWPRRLAAVLDSGVGGVVPRDVLNQIFYEDVATGKRRELSAEDKRVLYVSALEAYNAGAPVDPFILSMVEDWQKEITPGEVAQEMFEREGDQRSWFGRTVSNVIGQTTFGPGIGPGGYINRLAAAGVFANADDVTFSEGLAKAFKMTPEELGREFTVGSVATMLSDAQGPLSATKTDTVFSAAFRDNLIKSPIRAALGMPMGMYMAVTDPKGTGRAILEDYAQRYGQIWGDPDANFVESALMDPWAPAMDILGLVPVIGAGARGAQIARIAAVTSKINKTDWQAALKKTEPEFSIPSTERGVFWEPEKFDPTARGAEAVRLLEELNSGKPVRFVSARKFAAAQRAALTGDQGAYNRLVQLTPKGYGGLNSSYTPGRMDRVAAWFSPRYTAFSYRDVYPDGTPEDAKALNEVIAREAGRRGISMEEIEAIETSGGPLRRRAGSPIARGMQDLMFTIQKGVARRKPDSVLVNMPLIGFNLRYANALKSNPFGDADMLLRELREQAAHQALANAQEFTDAEQLAIMNYASGRMFSPGNLLAISLGKLERMRKDGVDETDDVLVLTQKEADLYQDPEFLREYEAAYAKIHTLGDEGAPVDARGKNMRTTAERIRAKNEAMRHRAGVEMDALSARELTLRNQLFLNAARLLDEDMLEELETAEVTDRIGVLNGGYHFLETGKVSDLPDGEGRNLRSVMQDIEGADDALYKSVIDEVRESVAYLGTDTSFRTVDNTPLFVVDSVFDVAGRKFVRGRRLRVRGQFEKDTERTYRDGSLIDDRPLTLPAEAFVKSKRGTDDLRTGDGEFIDTYATSPKSAGKRGIDSDMSELSEQLNRASLNFAMKLFPNARDFTDKVHIKNMMGSRESFAQAINRNVIASSGLMSFNLDIHYAALRNAAYRRFKSDIEDTIHENAILITREQAERFKGGYEALRTMAVHDTREAAQRYIDRERVRAPLEGDEAIIEYVVNGQTKYVTRMSFLDSTSYALKEAREQRLVDASEWQKAMFADLADLNYNNADNLIMVIPRGLADNLRDSYNRSNIFATKVMRGATSTFKLFALSLNPRFVTQQFFGTMVMMMIMNPMQAGHIMARFLQYSLNKRARATISSSWRKGIEVNPYENHGMDYDIILNRFIREFEDQIYGEDAAKTLGKMDSKARKVATFGYTVGMAIEKNFRVAIIREAAMNYPGFKDFMNSPEVAKRAMEGIPEMGYTTVTKFHAAMDLLSDPRSLDFDPLFLRELRHTADMVSGNYRDFSYTERLIRDYAVPFYAWTRHSALFTKRMVQERPLTANTLYNIGNYGYETIAEQGGLPDWLLESIPMPEVVAEVLGLDPEKDNRLGFGLINPFGTTGNIIEMVAGLTRGGNFRTDSGVFEITNPFIELAIQQSLGRSLLTGAPVDPEQGLLSAAFDSFETLPPLRIGLGLFKTSVGLNELRGVSNPEDILRDPFDPNSKLRVPKPKFSTKFPTRSMAGFVNSTLVPVYSLDKEQLGDAISREYDRRGVLYEEFKLNDRRSQLKTANALRNWQYKRDYVFNVWLPAFQDADPALVARVLQQLENEKPRIPKGFNPASVEAILSGRLD